MCGDTGIQGERGVVLVVRLVEAKFEGEVRYMFQRLLEPENRARIERLRRVLFPQTLWSGAQKKLDVLETIEF